MTTMSTALLMEEVAENDITHRGNSEVTPHYNKGMAKLQDTQGMRIKWLRQLKGMSQAQLVKIMAETEGVDITASFLSNIEKDHANPPRPTLIALAKVLSTTTDFILGLSENPVPNGNAGLEEARYMTPEAEEVAGIVDVIQSPYIRMEVVEVARRMVELERKLNAGATKDVAGLLRLIEKAVGVSGRAAVENVLMANRQDKPGPN